MANEITQPVKKGEADVAFEMLAAFLFEQYKKMKQAEQAYHNQEE